MLEAFDELNIAINYDKNLIHVYRHTHNIYPQYFEKIKNNWDLRGNVWHGEFVVGATQTQTRAETPIHMREMRDVEDDERAASPVSGQSAHEVRNPYSFIRDRDRNRH